MNASKQQGRQGKERINRARKDKRYNKFIGFYYVSRNTEKGDNVVQRKKKQTATKGKTTDRKLLHFITLLPCYRKKNTFAFCSTRSWRFDNVFLRLKVKVVKWIRSWRIGKLLGTNFFFVTFLKIIEIYLNFLFNF